MNISGLSLDSYNNCYTHGSQNVAGPSSAASNAALSPSHPPILFRSNIDDQSLAALDAALQQRHELARWANQALQNPGQLKITPDSAKVAPAQDKPVRYSWVIPSQEGHKDVLHLHMQQISDQPGRYELLALGRSRGKDAVDYLPIKRQPASSSNDRPEQKPPAGSRGTRSTLPGERFRHTPYQRRGNYGILSQERSNRKGKSANIVLKEQEHLDLLSKMRETLEKAKTGGAQSQKSMKNYSRNYIGYVRKFLHYLENNGLKFSFFLDENDGNKHPNLIDKIRSAVNDGDADYRVITALNKAFEFNLPSLNDRLKRDELPQKALHIELLDKMKISLRQQVTENPKEQEGVSSKTVGEYLVYTRRFLRYLENKDQALPEGWSAGEKRPEIERIVNDAIKEGEASPKVRAALNKAFGLGLLSVAHKEQDFERRKPAPVLPVHQELLKIVDSFSNLRVNDFTRISNFFVFLEKEDTSWPVFRARSLKAGSDLKDSIRDDSIVAALEKVLPELDKYVDNNQPPLTSKAFSSESIGKLHSCAVDLSLSEKTKTAMALVNSLSKESNPLAWVGREGYRDRYEVGNKKGQVIFVSAITNQASEYGIDQIGLRYANGTECSWSLD